MDSLRERPAETSYMAEIGVADHVWEQLAGLIPVDLLGELEHLVFVMIKPDAIAMGVHRQIVTSIQQRGWQIVSAQALVAPHPKSFEALYAFNLTARNEQNQVGVWWLNSRLYTAGSSIVLMLRIPGSQPYSEAIAWKGPSNPYLAADGQIRHDACGSNVAMNLIHCADGPVSSAREFLIFNTMNSLVDVLRSAADGTGRRRIDEDVETACVISQPGRRALDLPSAVLRAKLLLSASSTVQQDDEARARTRQQVALLESDLQLAPRWSALESLLARERDAGPIGRTRTLSTESRAVDILNDPASYSSDAAATVSAALREAGVVSDVWDELALETGMHYAADLRQAVAREGAA